MKDISSRKGWENFNPITKKLNIIGLVIFTILTVFIFIQTEGEQWIFPAFGVVFFLLARVFKNELLFASTGYYGAVYVIFVFNILYGVNASLHYAYITLCAIAFVIFGDKFRKAKIFALTITGGLFCTNYLAPGFYVGLNEISKEVEYGISAIFSNSSFFVMLFLVSSFSRSVLKKEKELKSNISTISNQKLALEQQSLALTETQKLAEIGQWSFNEKKDQIEMSLKTQEILGLTSSTCAVQDFLSHFSASHGHQLNKAIYGEFEGHDTVEKECEILKVNAEKAIIKIIAARKMMNNEKYQVFGVVQDMTQIIQNQKLKIENLNAVKLGEERALFLAKMSHELRTPISGIMNLADFLTKSELNPSQRKYVDSIASSSETLLLLVNDILDLSKIESGKMKLVLKPFNIVKETHLVHEIFSTKAEEQGVGFNLLIADDLPPKLIGDGVRLKQILFNLIGNAIKFTNKGTVDIKVGGKSLPLETWELEIIVKDSGIGIGSEHLENIFKPFIQVENKNDRSYGGTGLGLTVVKQLIELQGGTITVESALKVGTEFKVLIPFKIATLDTKDDDSSKVAELHFKKTLHVLVAEDNPINQMIIQDQLEEAGAIVTIVENGELAFKKVCKENFDVVLMDMQMPVMDGYTAMNLIRTELKISRGKLPIIALTAHVLEGEKEKCLEAGANTYLSKPYSPLELFNKIKELTLKDD